MIQRLFMAGTLASVLLLSPIAQRPAEAMTPAGLKAAGETPSIVTQVRRGGHGFGGHGVGGHGFGGHGFKSFSGGHGFRGFPAGPRFGGFRGHSGIRSGVYFGGKNWGGHRHHHNRRFFYGAPFVGYYGGYGYGYDGGYGDCGWLKRRAIVTGSGYWWRRYEACRYRYDY